MASTVTGTATAAATSTTTVTSSSWRIPASTTVVAAALDASECRISGGVSFLMQLLLSVTFVVMLILKSRYERKRKISDRSWQAFYMDSTKQVVGALLLHLLNVIDAVLLPSFGAGQCGTYFVSIITDTTLGVVVVFFLLKLSQKCIDRYDAEPGTFWEAKHFHSGNYFEVTDGRHQLKRRKFYKQLLVWCSIAAVMKSLMCLYMHLMFYPLSKLSWLILSLFADGDAKTFVVVFAIPLVMNTFQFWVQDNFIQDTECKVPKKFRFKPFWFLNDSQGAERLEQYMEPFFRLDKDGNMLYGDSWPLQPVAKPKAKRAPGPPPAPPQGQAKGKAKAKAKALERVWKGPQPSGDFKPRFFMQWKKIKSESIGGDSVFDAIRKEMAANSTKFHPLPGEELNVALAAAKASAKPKAKTKAKSEAGDGAALAPPVQQRKIVGDRELLALSLKHKEVTKQFPTVDELAVAVGRKVVESTQSWEKRPTGHQLEVVDGFLKECLKHDRLCKAGEASDMDPEVYFLALLDKSGEEPGVEPRVRAERMEMRVKAFLLMENMRPTLEDFHHIGTRVSESVNNIRISPGFKILIQYLLQLGNYINWNHTGMDLKDAEAFQLDALDSLASNKCSYEVTNARATSGRAPRRKDVPVLEFLKELMIKDRGHPWVDELKKELLRCCEAHDVDTSSLEREIKNYIGEIEVLNSPGMRAVFDRPVAAQAAPAAAVGEASGFEVGQRVECRDPSSSNAGLASWKAGTVTCTKPLTAIRDGHDPFAYEWGEMRLLQEAAPQPPAEEEAIYDRELSAAMERTKDLRVSVDGILVGERSLTAQKEQLQRYLALENKTIPEMLKSVLNLHDLLFTGAVQRHRGEQQTQVLVQEGMTTEELDAWLEENGFQDANHAKIIFDPMSWLYPLHFAVKSCNPAVVKALLENDAQADKKHCGWTGRELTPLKLARYYRSLTGEGEYDLVIKVLEEHENRTGDRAQTEDQNDPIDEVDVNDAEQSEDAAIEDATNQDVVVPVIPESEDAVTENATTEDKNAEAV